MYGKRVIGRHPIACHVTGARVGQMCAAQLLLVGTLLATAPLAAANDRDDQPDQVALWAALDDSGVTLEAGLIVGQQRGKPVSAKFDIADGDLELMISIATRDGLSHLLIDPNTASIVWSESISASDDLADATAQKAVIDRAKVSLLAAVQDALRDNKGARAVDVTPELHDGHPVAVITLLANGKFTKVSKWLE